MDHEEFRDALSTLGLTQRAAARLLGADERTARRWALGESDIPVSVDILVRLWLGDPAVLEATHALADERERAAAKAARKAAKR